MMSSLLQKNFTGSYFAKTHPQHIPYDRNKIQ